MMSHCESYKPPESRQVGITLYEALRARLEVFGQHVRDGGRAAATIRILRAHSDWLCERLGAETPIAELTPARLEALAADRRAARPGRVISGRTMLKRLCTLRAALKLAHRRGQLERVPVFPVIHAPWKPRPRIFHTVAQYRRLLDALPAHRAEWVALAFWTAMRASDVERATWGDLGELFSERPWILIRSTKTKRPPLRVPMPRELADLLRGKYRRLERELGRPPAAAEPLVLAWTNRGYMLPRAALSVGLPAMNGHDLRHSAIAVMIRRTGITRQAQEWGGWLDVKTMQDFYAHVLPARLGDVAAELDSWASEPANDNGVPWGRITDGKTVTPLTNEPRIDEQSADLNRKGGGDPTP